MSFFEELKRRNVFRVGIAYGVAGWVLLQVVDLVLDNVTAPDWVMHVFMLAVGVGFIAALVIAWAYELTPEGIKRESEVNRSQSVTQHTARKLDFITLAAVCVLIILMLADRFMPAGDTEQQRSVDPVPTSETAQTAPGIPAKSDQTSVEPALARGVAVLPFANMSEDPNNAFFAGGVHEDILTNLSRIADLRVISRTSMLKIAEQGLDMREIGRQLGVSHVLEGSVRRAGDQVRVTVQLIDASNDNHLWAENYDRKLDDIFAIQSEIAQKIAAQLETKLSPELAKRLAEAPTQNTQAYDLYLKARELTRTWLGADGFKQMRPLLEQAVALDPDFLEAQVLLGLVYGRLVWTGSDPDGIYRENALTVTQRILQKWPERPESDIAQGNYDYTVRRDYRKALVSYQKALLSMPNDTELMLHISSSHKRLDQYDQGLPIIRRTESLDPESATIASEVGFHLVGTGQADLAMEQFRKAVAKFPDDSSSRQNLANYSLALTGSHEEYFSQIKVLQDIDPAWVITDALAQRMLMDPVELDKQIARIEAYKADKGFWTVAALDRQIAELLNLANREEESQQIAAATLQSVENWLVSGQRLSGNTPEIDYAQFAYLACLADNHAAFEKYVARAEDAPRGEIGNVATSMMYIARATAECGDPEAGWAIARDNLGANYSGVSAWTLAMDPLYRHYYAGIAEFGELVASVKKGGG